MSTDPLEWIDEELVRLEQQGLRRQRQLRSGPQAANCVWDGRQLINFGSNDYLGLANQQDVSAAVQSALPLVGWGSGASPLVTGRGDWHVQLEKKLAQLERTESALLFSTGYAANIGAIGALVGKGDVIFSDAKNHASIIDGCRLSQAQIKIYPHRNVAALATQLCSTREARRRLIVTDSLFSMDGDIAPLPELAELAEQHQAMLMVDEAHATGIFGERGSGLCEHFGVEKRVSIRIGTLSKALGSIGGFAVGSQNLIDWLANRARPYVFSTALPEATAAAAIRALQIVHEEPQRRFTLLAHAHELRQQLKSDGWDVGQSQSQIIPVIIGEPSATMRLMQQLLEKGFFVPGIRPPSVPDGESLLRISLRHDHTRQHTAPLVNALRELRT